MFFIHISHNAAPTVWGWGYKQNAVCSAVRLADPTFISSAAIQRFTTEGGCAALLPSIPGYLSLV